MIVEEIEGGKLRIKIYFTDLKESVQYDLKKILKLRYRLLIESEPLVIMEVYRH